MNFMNLPPGYIQQLLKKQQAQPAQPMAYSPGGMRQFTPSPAPDVPFMPAPQVGPQQIPTGFGGPGVMPPPPTNLGLPGGQGPNIGPGMPPGGPNGMSLADVGNANVATPGRAINPQIAQLGMQLLQRSRSAPIQMTPMQMFRGGR